jgi:hypothetical protein
MLLHSSLFFLGVELDIQILRTNLKFWNSYVWNFMLVFSYIINHIITNKYKILYRFLCTIFSLNEKSEKTTESVSSSYSNSYIYHLKKYIWHIWGLFFINIYKINVENKTMNLHSTFYILFVRNQRKKRQKS